MWKRNSIGREVFVGSDGLISLVDMMGDDRRIVDAARISYGKHGKVNDPDKDNHLIRYMMREGHTSPFEQVEFVFFVRCPMDVWRQWIRHRTASVNEYSTRYSEAIDSMATTKPDEWRLQSESSKQGSEGSLDPKVGEQLTNMENDIHSLARMVYKDRLQHGVAREQARKDLPLSTYTEAFWKIDLHNLFHFLELRMDPHAQLEIRQYAEAIWRHFVIPEVPMAAQAFMDYRLNKMVFSGPELRVLARTLKCIRAVPDDPTLSAREHRDLKAKVAKLEELMERYND